MSLDGLEKVHNKLRPIQNKDTYNKIIENINKLKENNIDFNILTVLSKQLEPYGKEVFEMFLKNNFEHIQIIECLAELNESSKDSAYACTPSVYKSFYTDFYKAWIDSLRNGKYVSVNTINDAVRVLSNQMPASCGRLGFLEYKMSLK